MKYMERAYMLALQNVERGGQPFGAVLVKDGVIIGEGVNECHEVHDVTGHAELLAIRRAQRQLQTDQLQGATMYASGEPCPMCYAAMCFVGIDRVVYGASVSEAKVYGLGLSEDIYTDLKKERHTRELIHLEQRRPTLEETPLERWSVQQNGEE